MSASTRVLIKLQPTTALAAVSSAVNLRPMYEAPAAATGLGLAPQPAWFLADLPDGGPTPWDAAHTQAAAQLGLAPSDVLYVEPDLAHQIFADPMSLEDEAALALTDCTKPDEQTDTGGRIKGPGDAWHLSDDFSQLGSARVLVEFREPRTRIAHIDTGFDRHHESLPRNLRQDLSCNFADGNDLPLSDKLLDFVGVGDNSGHGTGTLGILAGNRVGQLGDKDLGGAPEAEVLSLRIANRVVLFYSSTLARALKYAIQQRCDVISLSMGGLPSAAWNEAINEAYEAGICMVAAAGNNFNDLPTRHLVYPARYGRVLAACGAMANNQPYHGLTDNVMQGNFGPDRVMPSAMAAYTPNIPWPRFGCPHLVDLDGQGTSSATPQVAAAVALWLEKYKDLLPRNWQRVEAVRYALFTSARNLDVSRLGQGIVQAKQALNIPPRLNLPMTQPESDFLAWLRVLTGLGLTEVPLTEKMFNLEIQQRWLLNRELQALAPDPGEELPIEAQRRFLDGLIADTGISEVLRRHLKKRYEVVYGGTAQVLEKGAQPPAAVFWPLPPVEPPFRRLRVYAMDPSLASHYETVSISEAVLKVRWEKVKPGPVGDYLEVFGDAAPVPKNKDDSPLNLDNPRLLAQDGWAPSEGNPAFHCQMVYAVAMKTIEYFERAWGRPVLWRPDPADGRNFVPQLKIYPDAFPQANAYYSPQQVALRFGYFDATAADPSLFVPGQRIHTCLSHDIIAHETTHAILDGMHSRFNEASNPDSLAFHEALADIVSLLQHFAIPEILAHAIRQSQGNLAAPSLMGSLAVQFGRALGQRGALREAIGRYDEQNRWTRIPPDPQAYQKIKTPHSRGALLVAAVFDAYLKIYQNRTADLVRLSTGGTGVLPAGAAIHPDLVSRLAQEAAIAAEHVLNMCIRALDYLPPLDITFYEYLRGIITADLDLVSDDRYNYRIAFIEAFQQRGLYPYHPDIQPLEPLSLDSLRWRGIDASQFPKAVAKPFNQLVSLLKRYANACFYTSGRSALFYKTRDYREKLKSKIEELIKVLPSDQAQQFAGLFHLDPRLPIDVHELRRSIRVGPNGNHIPQVIVALTQTRDIPNPEAGKSFQFGGGSTLILDLAKSAVQYAIFKDINSQSRETRTQEFLAYASADPLRQMLLLNRGEPFAALHAMIDLEE